MPASVASIVLCCTRYITPAGPAADLSTARKQGGGGGGQQPQCAARWFGRAAPSTLPQSPREDIVKEFNLMFADNYVNRAGFVALQPVACACFLPVHNGQWWLALHLRCRARCRNRSVTPSHRHTGGATLHWAGRTPPPPGKLLVLAGRGGGCPGKLSTGVRQQGQAARPGQTWELSEPAVCSPDQPSDRHCHSLAELDTYITYLIIYIYESDSHSRSVLCPYYM